jgi:S-adenosylmethionine decarboxylase
MHPPRPIPPSPLGVQILADFHGCDAAALDDVEGVRAAMVEAARRAGATIVSECFHRFSPHGVSGVVVIAESHLAVHTWPEHGYAAVDFFTCGDTLRGDLCFAWLLEAFGARSHTATHV